MTTIDHLAGVPWWVAPLPPVRHQCWPQTWGRSHVLFVERCACGATRIDRSGEWLERNSRTRPEPAPRRTLREIIRGWWR